MNKAISISIATAGAVLFAAGAAFAGKPDAEAAPDPRLGAEVNKICFARDINNWKEIDGVDDAVLLERSVNDWYRVALAGACTARVFRFAQVIGIENRPAGGCLRRGDAIIVDDTGNFTRRCIIKRMNEWNDDLPAPEEADEAPVQE